MGWEALVFSLFLEILQSNHLPVPISPWSCSDSISLLSTGTEKRGDKGRAVQGLGAELRVASGVNAFAEVKNNTKWLIFLMHMKLLGCYSL